MFQVELSYKEKTFLLNELHMLEAIFAEGEGKPDRSEPDQIQLAVLRDVIQKIVTAKPIPIVTLP